jgi:hypothetical protein
MAIEELYVSGNVRLKGPLKFKTIKGLRLS